MQLPVRSIWISEDNRLIMERNLWQGAFVPMVWRAGEREDSGLIRYRGAHTRAYPKRSYEVSVAGRTLHYNAEYDDPSMIRNALSFWFLGRIGIAVPRTQFVWLLMNGKSIGLYLEIEAVDRTFFAKRHVAVRSLFYAVNDRADFRDVTGSNRLRGYEHRFGGSSEQQRLRSFIRGIHRLSGEATKGFLSRRLDVPAYLNWLSGVVLTGNYDGFEQNYALYRSGRTGKWLLLPWDYEGTWGRNCYGKSVSSDLVPLAGLNHLTRALFRHAGYRNAYRERMKRLLSTAFSEKEIVAKAQSMQAAIAEAYRMDPLRKWPYSTFAGEVQVIRRYVRERRNQLLIELRNW